MSEQVRRLFEQADVLYLAGDARWERVLRRAQRALERERRAA